MLDLEQYHKEKEEARTYYKTINHVFSPALKEKIHFNSEGFNHLVYRKGREEERDKDSQLLRFKLLALAKNLVELSTTHQEYEEIFSSTDRSILFWGIIAIIRNRKIKVVLKKTGNGQVNFWSVIPAWKTSHYRDIRLFHTTEGDPEID